MPLAPKGWGTITVEGHGEIENAMPTFRLGNVIIVIFQGIGVGLDDQHGMDIAQGKGTQVNMPLLYDAHNHEYDTELPATGGHKVVNQGGRKTYNPGESCPNLKLYPYDHPQMGVLDVTDGTYKFKYNATNPNHFVRLSDIANQLDGTLILWGGCTVIRG